MAQQIDILINVQTAQFNKGIAEANTKLSTLGATTGRIMRTMTAFAALFIARGLIQGIGASVKAFADFEQGIAKIGILLGDEIGRLGEWNNLVSDVARELGIASKDLMKAGFDIQSATNDTSRSLEIFRQAARLAVAGGSDLTSTVKGALTLNEVYADSFMNVADMMDFMIVAQKKARATIGELSESSSKFLGVASSLGIKTEELFAVYAQLTRGFGNSKDAATGLSAIMNALQKPSGAMIKFAKEQFGTTIQQAVATEGLVEVLKRLRTVSNEMIGTTLGRIRANRAFGIIKTDMATIEESVIELMNREGQTAEKLAIQEKTLAFQTAQLREEWQFLMRAMGEGVASTKIVPGLKAIVKEFGLVLERNRELNAIIDRGRNAGEQDKELTFWGKLAQIHTTIRDRVYEWRKASITGGQQDLGGSAVGTATSPTLEFPEPEDMMEPFTSTMDLLEEEWMNHAGAVGEIISTQFEDMGIYAQQYLSSQEEGVFKLQEIWGLYQDEITGKALAGLQQQTEKYNFFIDTQKKANESLWVAAGKLRDTFSSGVSTMFMDMIKGTFDAKKAFTDLGLKMVQILIETAVQMVINQALAWAMRSAEIAGIIAFGKATAIALAPAAAMMSLITAGSNAIGAVAGLVGTMGAFMGAALGLKEGGIVPGLGKGDIVPAMLEPGELVIPKNQVGNVTNSNNPTVNVSMAGAYVMDDPVAVERLYREYLRDKIREDIRTRRDVFYT